MIKSQKTALPSFCFSVVLSFVTFVGCGLEPATQFDHAELSSFVPGNHHDLGRLGLGYNSFSEQFAKSNCVMGDTVEVGSASSQLDYLQNLDSSQLTKKMGITLGWSVPYLSLSPELEFVKSSSATKLSNTHVVLLQMKAKSEAVKGESLTLTPAGTALSGMAAQQVFGSCGNEYVSRIDYGGALLASLKIEFSSEDDKTEFNAKASLSIETGAGPAAINASFSRLSQKLRMRTRVVVSAKQFGGQPAGLLRIIPTGVANCTLEAVGECVRLFENLLAYAKEGFQDQYTKPTDYVPVGYVTTPYKEQISLANQLSFANLDSPFKIDFMAGLGQNYRNYLIDELKAQKLLGQYSGLLSPSQVADVQSIARSASFNASRTEQIMAQCAGFLSDAVPTNDSADLGAKEACILNGMLNYESQALKQKYLQSISNVTFYEPNPTAALEIKSSRPKNVALHHDIANGVLEIDLAPLRFANCSRDEWIEVSIPVSLEEGGTYQIAARAELGECPECEKSALLVFDEVKFPLDWATETKTQSTSLQVPAGNHRFGIFLRANNVCKSQKLSLKLRQLRLSKVLDPFSVEALSLN